MIMGERTDRIVKLARVLCLPEGASFSSKALLLGAILAILGALTACGDAHLPLLTSIQVSPANSTIDIAQTQQFTAVGTFSDGNTQDLTNLVNWSSSNTNVAAISSSGLTLSHSQGSSMISATFNTVDGPVTGTTTLSVAVTLKSLTITPVSPSIANSTSAQLTATGTFSDGSTQDLTASANWSSSSSGVATVSSSGLVRGTGVGSTTITATQRGVSAATTLTVTSAVLTAITITPPGSRSPKVRASNLRRPAPFSDGTTQDLTAFVTWASSASSVAGVSNTAPNQGLVTGSAVGNATITATLAGVSGATTLTVTSAVLTAIAVTPAEPSVANGTTVQLTATGTFSDRTTQNLTASAIWTSSSNAIATVSSSGLVRGTGVGSVTITATQAGVSGATIVTATAAVLSSITITPPDTSIAQGTSEQLTATGTFSDGTTQDLTASVTWISSAPSLVTVSNADGSQGLATGSGVGSATITATQSGVSGTTTVTVTSAVLTSIAITAPNDTLALGTIIQFTATATFSDGSTQDLTTTAGWTSSADNIATVGNGTDTGGKVTGVAQGSATITATQEGVSGTTTVTVTSATLVSISITPPNPSIANGTSEQLTATGTFSDGSTEDLTATASWTSSADNIATVGNGTDTGGKVTGVAQGSATITATQEGVSGTTTVTVTSATLVSISITPPNPSIANGTSEQLTATGTFSDGSTQDLTATASWTATPAGTVTVDPNGLVTGTAVGSATVTATQEGVSGTTTVTVTSATLVSISITPPNPSIANGTSEQLTATGTFSDGSTEDLTATASWTSSAAATVGNGTDTGGKVTGVAQGSATITATQEGVSGTTTVTVTSATLVSISITPPNPSIANGTSEQLTATGTFSDGSTEDLTATASWTSSAAATVGNGTDTGGKVTGVAQGSATITATQEGVSGTTTVTVTSATLVSISITPPNPSIANGTSEQLTATGTFSDGSTQDLTATASWTATPAGTVTVDPNGLVTGTAVGSATVTATQEGVSGTTTVTVTSATLVSISITPPNPSIANGTSEQLTATGTFSDGSTEDLTATASWTATPAGTVTVDPNGLVTGTAVGSATVTATQEGVSGTTTVTVTSATLVSISITPPNPSIANGTSEQLTATGTFSDGSTEDLTATASWTATPAGTVTVDPNGLVTGTGVGSATITANQAGASGATTVTVTAAVLTSITITPPNPSIAKGTTVQLTATGTLSDGTTQDLTQSVSWTSAPAGFATVDPNGLVTGTGVGSATITATQAGVSGSATVTVTAAVLTAITITPPNSSIALGTTVQLTATGTLSDGTTQDLTGSVSWFANPASTATVDPNGLLTGTKVGTAHVIAVQGTVVGSALVTVTAAVLTSITITPPNPSVAKGTTVQLTATGTFSDGTTQDFTASADWTSTADAIATVGNTGSPGLVTGTGVGSATITATQAGVSGSATVTVTAAVLTAITITPPNSSIALGTTVQLTATGTLSDGTTQDLTGSVSWFANPASTATVDPNGLLTGTKVGTAHVIAVQGTVVGSALVTVTAAVLTSITITPPNPSIALGTTVQLTATGTFSDGTTQDLTGSASWTSAPAGFATVDPNGLVTGTAVGSATVTANQAGASGATTVTVTPAVLTSIVIIPANPTLVVNGSILLIAIGVFSDGSMQNLKNTVSWTSSNLAVATVGLFGLLKGLGVGSGDH